MQDFDSRTAKYMVAVVIMAIVFIVIIGNAFKYLPDSTSNNVQTQYNQSNNYSENSYRYQQQGYSQSDVDNSESYEEQENYVQQKVPKNTAKKKSYELEEINIPDNTNEAAVKEVKVDIFANAKQYRKDKKYETAIVEYLNIADMSSDDEVKAECYDEVATMYAIMKRYNQAIMYAQRSCNIKPTGERTILMSRIYYQAGQKIKAEEKIQEMMQKGFE